MPFPLRSYSRYSRIDHLLRGIRGGEGGGGRGRGGRLGKTDKLDNNKREPKNFTFTSFQLQFQFHFIVGQYLRGSSGSRRNYKNHHTCRNFNWGSSSQFPIGKASKYRNYIYNSNRNISSSTTATATTTISKTQDKTRRMENNKDHEQKKVIDLRDDDNLKSFIQSGLLYPKVYPGIVKAIPDLSSSSSSSSSLSSSDTNSLPLGSFDNFDIEEWKLMGKKIYYYLYSQSETKEVNEMEMEMELERARRIFHLYLPLIQWCRKIIFDKKCKEEKEEQEQDQAKVNSSEKRTKQQQQEQQTEPDQNKEKVRAKNESLVLGIHAPQGCGKTTLCEILVHFLHLDYNLKVAALSIDDFYLKREDQQNLSDKFKNNPLLQCRGNAGTHDIQLGEEILKSLKYSSISSSPSNSSSSFSCTSSSTFSSSSPTASFSSTTSLSESRMTCKLPRYDKSKFGGLGDRTPIETWPEVDLPVDLIVIEGWMLGFQSLSESELSLQIRESSSSLNHANLELINTFMKNYSRWYNLIDAWMIIQVANIEQVYNWRMEAEVKMIAEGREGMTKEQVIDFVGRYMPAYQIYLPTLYTHRWLRHRKEHGNGPNKNIYLPQISFPVEDSRLPPLE